MIRVARRIRRLERQAGLAHLNALPGSYVQGKYHELVASAAAHGVDLTPWALRLEKLRHKLHLEEVHGTSG